MARPRIGLALGSGAARGWSHIGVIRALHEIGIKPDIVTGASVGAVVGAALAAGKLDPFADWIGGLDRMGVFRLLDAKLSGGGFIQGRTLLAAIEKHIGNPDIEDLELEFGAVATELGTGREVWLRKGPVLDAVHASMTLPGLFAPVKMDGQYLLDGGIVNPVPVSLARAMGAQIVIAVNLNGDLVGHDFLARRDDRFAEPILTSRQAEVEGSENIDEEDHSTLRAWVESLKLNIGHKLDRYVSSGSRKKDKAPEPGLFDVIIGAIDIMQDRITRARMAGEPPDVHITPRLRQIGVMDFDRAEDAIKEGHAATLRQRADLDVLARALAHYKDA